MLPIEYATHREHILSNMLPIGSIFFPLKVAPIRTDNKFKDTTKLNYNQYISLLQALNFEVTNIKWFTVSIYDQGMPQLQTADHPTAP